MRAHLAKSPARKRSSVRIELQDAGQLPVSAESPPALCGASLTAGVSNTSPNADGFVALTVLSGFEGPVVFTAVAEAPETELQSVTLNVSDRTAELVGKSVVADVHPRPAAKKNKKPRPAPPVSSTAAEATASSEAPVVFGSSRISISDGKSRAGANGSNHNGPATGRRAADIDIPPVFNGKARKRGEDPRRRRKARWVRARVTAVTPT